HEVIDRGPADPIFGRDEDFAFAYFGCGRRQAVESKCIDLRPGHHASRCQPERRHLYPSVAKCRPASKFLLIEPLEIIDQRFYAAIIEWCGCADWRRHFVNLAPIAKINRP